MKGIAGFSGHLVTPSFIARYLAVEDAALLRRWRETSAACAQARARLGPASSVRAVFEAGGEPFVQAMGFGSATDVQAADRYIAASLRSADHLAAFLTIGWAESIEAFWRIAVLEAQRRGAAWCLVFNGLQLRVVDASRLYGRRHVEFDLPLVLDAPQSFAGMSRVAGAGALFSAPGDRASLHALAAESDRNAAGVCRSLREGVLSASASVLGALLRRERGLSKPVLDETFEQALTIVYRIVFLLFAESRALVPIWHPVYRESYTVEALREASEGGVAPRGLWDALRAMARLAHSGCSAGDLRVTPFNGRLFAPARTPLAERRGLDDAAARQAVLDLSTRPAADRSGRERIVYRELGVEQLGAVYETLLDYEPRVAPSQNGSRRRDGSVSLEPGTGVRKATGTFYTPQPLADYLVRRTLSPLVQDATATAILGLRIVDPAMGSGAFLVAACRYLAAAYERALVASGARAAGEFDEADRTAIRRLVAERCLYGVDVNPMAVQLARLSLWLTTLASDRPLSFLDHRLMTGDSLLGAWLWQLRQAPARARRSGRRSDLPLFGEDLVASAMTAALPIRFSLEETPDDTLDQVRTKERAFAALSSSGSALSRWKRIADVWCATWFAPDLPVEAFRSLADDILCGSGALSSQMSETYRHRAAGIAAARRFFHWELEFPEVFFHPDGSRRSNPGFDAVIGNPPWDMMRADAAAADSPSARNRARLDVSTTVRFARDAGSYRACGQGHCNRYQLFVERAMALTRANGRLGLVLPSGLAADHGSATLRRELLSRCDVDAIVGVDNVRGIFPIHRSVRFVLVTATAGRPTVRFRCRFGVESAAELDGMGDDPSNASLPVEFTPGLIERLSGPLLSIPHVREPIDVRIAEKAASMFAPLGSADGWAAAFGRELNASDDRDLFRAAGEGWPVIEGKHLEPFQVSIAGAALSIAPADARRRLGAGRVEGPRLAYRDVASATNRVTLISAILPARTVSTHTVFCLRSRLPLRHQYALCGLFNSLVVNYLVRLRVTTHVTTAIVERLPVPTLHDAPAACREIGALARRLSRTRTTEAFGRLNARVAHLYQLTREEFEHVLSTFPLIDSEQRMRALAAFLERRP